jgi:hypothetical protein
LPIVSTKPKFSEKSFLLPLMVVFVVTNSSFLFAGFYTKQLSSPYFGHWPLSIDFPITSGLVLMLTALFAATHWAGYRYMIYHRNNLHLRSYRIGVDIDGVLNEQTSHFIKWLEILTGKRIKKDEIKEIPISLNTYTDSSGGSFRVSDMEERAVFCAKEYWTEMPAKPGASKRMNDFHNKFGYRVLIFTYRDWPQYGKDEAAIKQMIISQGKTPLKAGEIRKITKEWLQANDISATIVGNAFANWRHWLISLFVDRKKATIERGNAYISDNRYLVTFRRAILTKNRFQGASLTGLKFFVEDTPENAIKLSSLCQYVFLINEPYNQKSKQYNLKMSFV